VTGKSGIKAYVKLRALMTPRAGEIEVFIVTVFELGSLYMLRIVSKIGPEYEHSEGEVVVPPMQL